MTEPTRILAGTKAARAITRELNRRNFLALAAAGATGVLAGCSSGGSGSSSAASAGASPAASGGALEDALSIYTWGEYDSPDVIKAFTTDKGPKITLDSYSSNEEMISKLVAAKGTGGYDIVVPTGTYIPQMVQNGLLQKINRDLLPNLKHMDPQFLGQAWDPTNDYSVCKAWGTSGFVYDTTVVKRELKTWADFLDAAQKEASGKTSLLDDPAELTSAYFWANGIDWNTTDAAQLDAAEAFMLDKIAPHVAAFDSYPGGGAIPAGHARADAGLERRRPDRHLREQDPGAVEVGPRVADHRDLDGQLDGRRRGTAPRGRSRLDQLHDGSGQPAQAGRLHRVPHRRDRDRGRRGEGRAGTAGHGLLHPRAGGDDEERRHHLGPAAPRRHLEQGKAKAAAGG